MHRDIEHIRMELDRRGWSQADLADKLGLHQVSVSRILSGKQKLTESVARHIELLFSQTKTAVFMYSIDLPDATCQEWVPTWDLLNHTQRVKAVEAVVHKILQRLASLGSASLSEEDRQIMRRFSGLSDSEISLEAAESEK